MRSSNWEDVRSFHFLMTVQMMAVPPTHAAMTTSTVNVARVILDADSEEEAVGELLAEASDACVVTVTWVLDGVPTIGEAVIPVMDGREAVDKDVLGDNDEVVLEEEVLEVELVWVVELRRVLAPKGSLVEEDDCCEVEAAGVLEEAGAFVEGAGVLDGVGVELAAVLDADDVPVSVAVVVGGSAPAPLAAPALAASALPLPPPKSPPMPPCAEGARFLIRRLRLT